MFTKWEQVPGLVSILAIGVVLSNIIEVSEDELGILPLFKKWDTGKKIANAISRTGDVTEVLRGPLIYMIVLTLITMSMWRENPLSVICVSQMCAGDGFADIVGRKFGDSSTSKLVWNKSKSYVGSLAFVVASFASTALLFGLFQSVGVLDLSDLGYSSSVQLFRDLFVISLVCAIAETVRLMLGCTFS